MKLRDAGLILLILLSFGAVSAQQYQYPTQPSAAVGETSQNVNSYMNFPFPGYNISTGYEFNASYNMSSAFSLFSEYYTSAGMPIVGGIVSAPVQFNIAENTPSTIYFMGTQPIPYSQYTSTPVANGNQLWIQGATDWTQYIVSPVGTWLQLVAYAPAGGNAYVYEIIQTSASTVRFRQYQLYPGYNSMSFYAGQAGRHMLYFMLNNQPSNIVVIDAVYSVRPSTITVTPSQPAYTSPVLYPTTPTPRPVQTPISGNVPVTIRYPGAGPFDVYLDGNYVGTGIGGSFSFSAPAGTHDIRVWDGSFDYEKPVTLESGIPKIVYVEAV